MRFFYNIINRLNIGKFLFQSKLGRFLFLCFLSFSLIPFGVVCYVFYQNTYSSLYQNTFNSLAQSALLKKANIICYYKNILKEVDSQARSKRNIEIMLSLTHLYDSFGLDTDSFVKSDDWLNLKSDYIEDIQITQRALRLQNIYYIDNKGNILLNALDNKLLGSNIFDSGNKDTSFSKSCYRAINEGSPFISDFEFFVPSEAVSNFIVQPILSGGRNIGLIAFQLLSTDISSVLSINTGLHKTYEAYIIGEDLVVKSSSKMTGEIPVLNRKINTEISAKWLKHANSKKIFNELSDKEHKHQRSPYKNPMLNASLYKGYTGNKVLGIFCALDSLEDYGLNWALVSEIDTKEAFASLVNLRRIGYILFVWVAFVAALAAIPVTKYVVHPIRELADKAKKLANRDLDFMNDFDKVKIINNEIGELNLNFSEVINSFKEISSICQSIALGDLSKSIAIKSGRDIIADSINTMSAYLRTIVEQANSIANNDYSVLVTPLSDHDELGQAIFNMTNTLMEVTIENKKQNWYKSCLAELNDKIRGEQDITRLCQKIISCIATQLTAYVGAIYLLEDDGVLKLRGSYAYNSSDVVALEFKIGEGLIGQAALERKPFNINNVPDDYVRIKSASGEAAPKRMFIFPVLFDNALKAVIELGSFYDFNSQQMEYIDQACEYIAISIDVAKSHTKLTELLEETQQQSKELQIHQNELKLSNETLKNITQELLNSEKQLKQQQEELKFANEELEEKSRGIEKKKEEVYAKNLALEKTKKELEDKAKELEKISKYKSEFLANMSHELRTPLNSLLILARDLYENESKNLTPAQVEAAEIIYKSGTDLLDLINDILDISKVEAGKMTINITTVPLKDISDKISFNFDRLAKEKGLYLNISIDEDLPFTIETDPQRIDQIIKNLISNAIKFTDQGGIDVIFSRANPGVVFTKCDLDAKESICISIKDTGIGIPKDKQSTIFEAFRQADGSTSRKYGGTGLGLSISQELALLLGGEIQVESEESKGSIFTLYIPFHERNKASRNIKNDRKVPKIEKKNNHTNYTKTQRKLIVLISDAKRENKQIKDFFEAKNIDFIYSSYTGQCLEIFKDKKPDGIILNFNQSAKRIKDFYDSLRKDVQISEIPVYLISPKLKHNLEGSLGYCRSALNTGSVAEAFSTIEKFYSGNSANADNEPEDKTVNFNLNGKNILIVDDDMRNSFALSKIMEDKGMNVVKAANGREAIEALEQEKHIDIVLMDIMMPVLDGYETIKIIRGEDKFLKLPIIALTAKAMQADRNKCIECGANDYISKPVNIDNLLYSIGKLLFSTNKGEV